MRTKTEIQLLLTTFLPINGVLFLSQKKKHGFHLEILQCRELSFGTNFFIYFYLKGDKKKLDKKSNQKFIIFNLCKKKEEYSYLLPYCVHYSLILLFHNFAVVWLDLYVRLILFKLRD